MDSKTTVLDGGEYSALCPVKEASVPTELEAGCSRKAMKEKNAYYHTDSYFSRNVHSNFGPPTPDVSFANKFNIKTLLIITFQSF